MKARCVIRLVSLLATVVLWQGGGLAGAQRFDEDASLPRTKTANWALLIGIEQYEQAAALRYTVNDVVQIAHTLSYRGIFAPTRSCKSSTTPQTRTTGRRKTTS